MCDSGISYAMKQYDIESIHRVRWGEVDKYINKGHKILDTALYDGMTMFIMGIPRQIMCVGSGWENHIGAKEAYQEAHGAQTMIWKNKIGLWQCPECGWTQ